MIQDEAEESGNASVILKIEATSLASEDLGTAVFLASYLSRNLGRSLRHIPERSVSGLMVSPELLGLGEKYGVYNPARFEAGVRLLAEAVHERRKVVVMEDVKTSWRRDVVSTMPFYALSGSVANAQVIA